jgi:hypothetical protein
MPGHSSMCSYASGYGFVRAVYDRIVRACRSIARVSLTCLGETPERKEADAWSDGVERGVYLGTLLGLTRGYELGIQEERSRATAAAQRQRITELFIGRTRHEPT